MALTTNLQTNPYLFDCFCHFTLLADCFDTFLGILLDKVRYILLNGIAGKPLSCYD